MLYGTSDSEPQTDIVVAQLSQELYNSGLLVLLIHNLARVDFEVIFILLNPKLFSLKLCILEFSGEEGCCPDFQQYSEEADRDSVTHCGVHLHQARNPLHPRARV